MINKELAHLIIVFILFLLVLSIILFIPYLIDRTRNNNYIDKALKNKDQSYCYKIVTKDYQESCYYKLAIYTKNKNLCEKSGVFKEKCLSSINQN